MLTRSLASSLHRALPGQHRRCAHDCDPLPYLGMREAIYSPLPPQVLGRMPTAYGELVLYFVPSEVRVSDAIARLPLADLRLESPPEKTRVTIAIS